MKWSLSEFLNLFELRSQSWCFANVAPLAGFHIPHNNEIFFYIVLKGEAYITCVSRQESKLYPGDTVMVLSGEAHAIRNSQAVRNCKESSTVIVEFLCNGEYVDTPPTFTIGKGQAETQFLCGRLKVRWPGGQRPGAIPNILEVRSDKEVVSLPLLATAATGDGASSILTRLANLLFVYAFRENSQCQEIFRQFDVHDPILRALHFIKKHPFIHWTVEILATKVGMGRSNFAKLFVEDTGKTPMQVVMEERMEYAADSLRKTDLKIGEISERIGYRSEAAFNRRFKKLYGLTPGQMRKMK